MGAELIPGYVIHHGSRLDRALLVKFMERTYHELYHQHDFSHLAQTVDRYLAGDTQLWWVFTHHSFDTLNRSQPSSHFENTFVQRESPIGCIWLGNAIDQVLGDRHTYIFLLYVMPHHRNHGVGSALMKRAETWARERGDRQIGLQVFQTNQPALALYQNLGYETKSIWMSKSLR